MAVAGGELYTVTPLREADIGAVARLHITGFGESFFLVTLGEAALRAYYRTFLDYPAACGFVCRERASGAVVGFVCGTEDLRHHYRIFLRRRLLPALPALAVRALTRPSVALGLLRRGRQVARTVLHRRATNAAAPLPAPLPPTHLLSMAVDPGHRGHGIGTMLAQAFLDEMARRNVSRVVLGVRDENHAARRLYERLGWRPTHVSRSVDGTVSWLYVRDRDEVEAAVARAPAPESHRAG